MPAPAHLSHMITAKRDLDTPEISNAYSTVRGRPKIQATKMETT